MADTATYPYATHLDIKFDPLTLIDVSSLAKTVTDQWYNQTLCKVNESVIRLGVMQGEYHWHKHDNDDEFFFVLSGRFIIDLEGHSTELLANQGFTVPKGVLHRTRAPERSVILMVETAAIVPTGMRLVACLTMCLMPILANAAQADAQAPSDPQAYCVNRSGDFYPYRGEPCKSGYQLGSGIAEKLTGAWLPRQESSPIQWPAQSNYRSKAEGFKLQNP